MLAAVDLGSNSFRLQVGRVVGDQIYPLDSLREPVRLAAGLTPDKLLDEASQQRAVACLRRFGERLRSLPVEAVRAVGTNSLRVAKNAPAFLKRAQIALGFPIEVVAGREEARLIYLGVTHSLPFSSSRRLVVDIGGGSTEFIIGQGFEPLRLESLYMGCVSFSVKYFPDGRITKGALKRAELAARAEVEAIAADFGPEDWEEAVGSSGTAAVLAEMLELNGFSDSGITAEGLDRLRHHLLSMGHTDRLVLAGIKPDRAQVLAGGFAIMAAIFAELGVRRMTLSSGAMRQGILYDLLGRVHRHDMRDATVTAFMERYHADRHQAARVEALALALLDSLRGPTEESPDRRLLAWAARLHEIGLTVAHSGYHKHSAYIIKNADMPGFSKMEQARLGALVLSHRGGLEKMRGEIKTDADADLVLALRLAALFCRNREDPRLPPLALERTKQGFRLSGPAAWMEHSPLTAYALATESREWRAVGWQLEAPLPKGEEESPESAVA